jgi:ubiquitin carboxyl-terminal hydrolase 36/42
MMKLKSPALGSSTTATTEPASFLSPPPAKKLALSAKKVGLWGSQ